MGAIATTVTEQIEILRKRGLKIDMPNEKVQEILLDIGYYRLGFYWHPFEIDEKHNFKDGSSFSDAVTLYYFDVDLRNIFLKYLNRIEINLKTSLIYHASNAYIESPTWFSDSKVMYDGFLKSLNKYYDDKFISNNKAIKKHHQKYINDKYAPAWKTLEFFSFGTILSIYKNLRDDQLKTKIAALYGIKNIKTFENHFSALVVVRNVCAHGGVLYDFQLQKGLKLIQPILVKDQRHSLIVVLKLIEYYLNQISQNRGADFKSTILEKLNKIEKTELKSMLRIKLF
jgi:abortive infection bacteriophage resistance protein